MALRRPYALGRKTRAGESERLGEAGCRAVATSESSHCQHANRGREALRTATQMSFVSGRGTNADRAWDCSGRLAAGDETTWLGFAVVALCSTFGGDNGTTGDAMVCPRDAAASRFA